MCTVISQWRNETSTDDVDCQLQNKRRLWHNTEIIRPVFTQWDKRRFQLRWLGHLWHSCLRSEQSAHTERLRVYKQKMVVDHSRNIPRPKQYVCCVWLSTGMGAVRGMYVACCSTAIHSCEMPKFPVTTEGTVRNTDCHPWLNSIILWDKRTPLNEWKRDIWTFCFKYYHNYYWQYTIGHLWRCPLAKLS